ncbi:hypothetical protein BEE12_16165 [Pantoea agglomerans]|uniref:YdaS family helix-turn-helix protein n=1 Tax=Enterobacter agglomerans TaxID=549 RepID=UPI00083CDA07|nr:YdaS family helix-turn-helix protein [Pantoea agglomerans]AOE41252.1 hypothetical protein BEE12_16165 [Pantoea agglomerans]
MKHQNPGILRAIEIVGSQSNLAAAVGTCQPCVSRWVAGGGIQSQFLPHIERATAGAVSMLDCIKGQMNYFEMP